MHVFIFMTAVLSLSISSSFASDLESAIVAYKAERLGQAKPMFMSVVNEPANKNEALYYLARISFDEHDYEKAKDYLNQSVALEPNSSDEYYWLGYVYGELAKQDTTSLFKKATYASNSQKYLQLSVTADPQNIEAHRGLFWFYISAPTVVGGGIDKAEKKLADIRSMSIFDADLLQLSLYQRKEEKDRQLAQAQLLMANYPNSVEAVYAAALEFFSQKKLEPAIAAFDAASILPKTKRNAYMVESSILYFAGTCAWAGVRIDEAISRTEKLLELKAGEKNYDRNVAYWTLAKLYYIKGNKEKYQNLCKMLEPDFIKRTQWMKDDIDSFERLHKKS